MSHISDVALRADLAALSDWIPRGAHILDLGCGDGALLSHLANTHAVTGYGLEIDEDKIPACIARGVNVIQADINEGLEDFDDQTFDVVLMNQALQALERPDEAVEEMLRVGKKAIVTFPNFGYWRVRLSVAIRGRMPVTASLPDQWFNTPNTHLCTLADFDELARQRGWRILRRSLLDRTHHNGLFIRMLPNLFTEVAIYELQKN